MSNDLSNAVDRMHQIVYRTYQMIYRTYQIQPSNFETNGLPFGWIVQYYMCWIAQYCYVVRLCWVQVCVLLEVSPSISIANPSAPNLSLTRRTGRPGAIGVYV